MKVGNPNSMPNVVSNPDIAKTSKLGTGPESILDSKKSTGAAALDKATLDSSARVDLSPRATELRKAKELATPSESIDEAKVARLQKLIDEGKYKVDAEAIADRLLDEHMKMS